MLVQSIRNLELISQQLTGAAQSTTSQQQSSTTYGKIVSSVSSVTSLVSGGGPQIDQAELIRSMDTLKIQHRHALSLLDAAHIVTEPTTVEHLHKAESIASDEYHDAETGFAYDLDDAEVSSPSTDDDRSSFYSTDDGSETEADDDDDDDDDAKSDKTAAGQDSVKRRTKLPHPVAGEEVSLFGLLKKNMGKVGLLTYELWQIWLSVLLR